MKKSLRLIITVLLFLPAFTRAQVQQGAQPQQVTQLPNQIRPGFYMKFGPVFPMGTFATGSVFYASDQAHTPLIYLPAKIGFDIDFGYLIYIGPAFANNHLRAGIDASFLTFSFNSTQPVDKTNVSQHYYYFGGQKFGPLITINPIDKLMIDLSYKINANFAYYYGEWGNISDGLLTKYGTTFLQNEVSFSLRYRIALFSVEYNFGSIKYDNMSTSKPQDRTFDLNTLRVLVGFKF